MPGIISSLMHEIKVKFKHLIVKRLLLSKNEAHVLSVNIVTDEVTEVDVCINNLTTPLELIME